MKRECARCGKRLKASEVAANWDNRWFACLPCWDLGLAANACKPIEGNAMNVADLRQRLGLSQLKFAIELGVDPMTVSRWERGLHEPSDEHRERLEKLERSKNGGTA